MVVKMRFRRFLLPIALYCATGAVVSYFAHHAYHGQRGLNAKREYKIKIADLKDQLDKIGQERASWERRVALMRNEAVDKDLLEERSRVILNNAHKNDVVVIFDQSR